MLFNHYISKYINYKFAFKFYFFYLFMSSIYNKYETANDLLLLKHANSNDELCFIKIYLKNKKIHFILIF